MQTTIELTKEDFWHPIPVLFDKLNNKKGAVRFIYLFLDEYWWQIFGEEDYRALTALFYSHINPYGSFEVDLTKRLIIQQIIIPTIEEVLA